MAMCFRVRGKCENRKALWNEIIACGQKGKNVSNVVIHLAGGRERLFSSQYFMYTEWGDDKLKSWNWNLPPHLSLEWLWTRHRVTLSLWFSICRDRDIHLTLVQCAGKAMTTCHTCGNASRKRESQFLIWTAKWKSLSRDWLFATHGLYSVCGDSQARI